MRAMMHAMMHDCHIETQNRTNFLTNFDIDANFLDISFVFCKNPIVVSGQVASLNMKKCGRRVKLFKYNKGLVELLRQQIFLSTGQIILRRRREKTG